MSFDERINNIKLKLNDTDDLIIEYIQEKRNDMQHISIHKIAEELYISPNSIMRTSKKLGYSGFSELKFSIQNEENPEIIKLNTSSLVNKIPKNIIKTMNILDEKDICDISKSMINSNKVLVAGIGDSVYFCETLGRYMRCLGKRVDFFNQIHDIEYNAKFYNEGDVVVIISTSGTTPRLVQLAKDIKQRNPKTEIYCITHFGENELSKICDKQICFWGEKRIVDGYNVTDRVGLSIVIRMICDKYSKMLK